MNLRIWLLVLLMLTAPLSLAQHQAVRGQQLHPCSCWSPSTPCKCNFLAVWFHPKTGKIWGGSGDKDKTEAGVRAHAEKRVATWGQWDSFYRKYEIVCGKCVDKESLSTHVKRIASVEFDQWADRAIKAILAQADINDTLKKLIGAKASLEKPFKDYANNLAERAKDLMALQKELDRELLVHTSKLEELLDRASQAHVQLQAKPLLARGFVYDKASGVFGYGSVDENGAKDGPWNGWYLGDGEFSTPESGALAFAGSFQKGRRDGAWKLAGRFPAMTLEGQFTGDKAQGAWTIRDASGQSMSGAFEGGVWKGEASVGKVFSNAMEPFSVLFGETASISAELTKSYLKALDEHIATLRKESEDLHERINASVVFRKVNVQRGFADHKAYGDRVEASRVAWHSAAKPPDAVAIEQAPDRSGRMRLRPAL